MSAENNRQATIDAALADKKKVVFGDDLTLQLDLDGKSDRAFSLRMLKKCRKILKIKMVTERESKSAGHLHVYVHLSKPVNSKRRFAYQAMLGSDRMREWLNYTSPECSECFLIEDPKKPESIIPESEWK